MEIITGVAVWVVRIVCIGFAGYAALTEHDSVGLFLFLTLISFVFMKSPSE